MCFTAMIQHQKEVQIILSFLCKVCTYVYCTNFDKLIRSRVIISVQIALWQEQQESLNQYELNFFNLNFFNLFELILLFFKNL